MPTTYESDFDEFDDEATLPTRRVSAVSSSWPESQGRSSSQASDGSQGGFFAGAREAAAHAQAAANQEGNFFEVRPPFSALPARAYCASLPLFLPCSLAGSTLLRPFLFSSQNTRRYAGAARPAFSSDSDFPEEELLFGQAAAGAATIRFPAG